MLVLWATATVMPFTVPYPRVGEIECWFIYFGKEIGNNNFSFLFFPLSCSHFINTRRFVVKRPKGATYYILFIDEWTYGFWFVPFLWFCIELDGYRIRLQTLYDFQFHIIMFQPIPPLFIFPRVMTMVMDLNQMVQRMDSFLQHIC